MKEIKFVDPEEAKIPSENPVCKIIIQYLKNGLSQKQIAFNLQANEIKPNSLSSVEKYIKALREEYQAKTMFHLACILFEKNELEINEKTA